MMRLPMSQEVILPDVATRGNYTDEPAAIPTYSGRSLRYIGASFPDVRCGSNVSFCPSASHFRSTPVDGHRQTGPVGPFGVRTEVRICGQFRDMALTRSLH